MDGPWSQVPARGWHRGDGVLHLPGVDFARVPGFYRHVRGGIGVAVLATSSIRSVFAGQLFAERETLAGISDRDCRGESWLLLPVAWVHGSTGCETSSIGMGVLHRGSAGRGGLGDSGIAGREIYLVATGRAKRLGRIAIRSISPLKPGPMLPIPAQDGFVIAQVAVTSPEHGNMPMVIFPGFVDLAFAPTTGNRRLG